MLKPGGKLLCFNLAFLALFFGLKEAFWPGVSASLSIVPAFEVGFLVYDYALKKLILFYIRKIARRLN